MIVDGLTKKKHRIPYITDENSITAKATAYLLLNNV